MINQQQVISKLNALKAYSVQQAPSFESYFTSLMQPVYTAVNQYFSSGGNYKAPLEECIFNLYCDITDRGIVYDDDLPRTFRTDFPSSYNDLRLCFYQFPLLNVSNETFYNAWVIQAPDLLSPEVPVSNPYLTQWATEISSAHTTNIANINSLTGWLQDSTSSNDMVGLLEESGAVLSSLSTEQVGKKIYLDRGVLDIIQTLNLNVYIPSYV